MQEGIGVERDQSDSEQMHADGDEKDVERARRTGAQQRVKRAEVGVDAGGEHRDEDAGDH